MLLSAFIVNEDRLIIFIEEKSENHGEDTANLAQLGVSVRVWNGPYSTI